MSPLPSTNSNTNAVNPSGTVTSSTVAADKNMFLQLLVAQLRNQDPMNPMDSSAFVTQLAQFQQLESTVNMSQDIAAIRSDADQLLGGADSTSGAGATQSK